VVPPLVAPRPAALETRTAPLEIVVAPLKLLLPERVSVPVPALFRAPLPLRPPE